MRRPPLGGSGGRLPVRLGGEEPGLAARLSPARQVCTRDSRGASRQAPKRGGTPDVRAKVDEIRSHQRTSERNSRGHTQRPGIVAHLRHRAKTQTYPGEVTGQGATAAAFFDLDKTVI